MSYVVIDGSKAVHVIVGNKTFCGTYAASDVSHDQSRLKLLNYCTVCKRYRNSMSSNLEVDNDYMNAHFRALGLRQRFPEARK